MLSRYEPEAPTPFQPRATIVGGLACLPPWRVSWWGSRTLCKRRGGGHSCGARTGSGPERGRRTRRAATRAGCAVDPSHAIWRHASPACVRLSTTQPSVSTGTPLQLPSPPSAASLFLCEALTHVRRNAKPMKAAVLARASAYTRTHAHTQTQTKRENGKRLRGGYETAAGAVGDLQKGAATAQHDRSARG